MVGKWKMGRDSRKLLERVTNGNPAGIGKRMLEKEWNGLEWNQTSGMWIETTENTPT